MAARSEVGMRDFVPTPYQPLRRDLVAAWLAQRQQWFARHVECPVRAFDPDGVWRGRTVQPTPRTWAVRVTDWARYLSTQLRHPVAASAIMATGYSMTLADISDGDIRRTIDDVRAWRRHRMMDGPFREPDSQDMFHVLLTRELMRHDADVR